MKLLGTIFLTLLFLLCGSISTNAQSRAVKRAESATGVLWIHISPGLTNDDGEPISEKTGATCTFFNIEKTKGGYIAASAAHCFDYPKEILDHLDWTATYGQPTLANGERVSIFGASTEFYFDPPTKRFKVTLLEKGDPEKNDDVSIFFIQTKEKRAVLNFADSDQVQTGDVVLNVSAPDDSALDKGLFEGIVSNPSLIFPQDPSVDKHIHVSILGPGAGSSGSAVFDTHLDGVIGILVQESKDGEFVCVPSDTVVQFIAAHKIKR